MEKFCPKCGMKIAKKAKFCPHCGYDFTSREGEKFTPVEKKPVSPSRAAKKTSTRKKSKRPLIITVLIIAVLALGGGAYWFINNNSNNSAHPAASSSSRQPQRSASSSSSSANHSSAKGDNVKLSASIGPKASAAAVTYYAAKNNVDGWSSMIKSDDLEVDLSTDDDLLGSLSEDGQGMAYIISDGNNTGSRLLVYTIDKDDTINIYSLPNDYDSDNTYEPVKKVAKADMINTINSRHYAAGVKKL